MTKIEVSQRKWITDLSVWHHDGSIKPPPTANRPNGSSIP
jgi:hypothetical protein